jgi:hypothetical protein
METGSTVGVQAAKINSQTIKTIGIFCFTIRPLFYGERTGWINKVSPSKNLPQVLKGCWRLMKPAGGLVCITQS